MTAIEKEYIQILCRTLRLRRPDTLNTEQVAALKRSDELAAQLPEARVRELCEMSLDTLRALLENPPTA